jgi:hypothetical protein
MLISLYLKRFPCPLITEDLLEIFDLGLIQSFLPWLGLGLIANEGKLAVFELLGN